MPDGTDFSFFTHLWRDYPQHQVLLITDGDGLLPGIILPADRRRTTAIVIPDGKPHKLRPLCERTVVLDNVGRLAAMLAMLVPGRRV